MPRRGRKGSSEVEPKEMRRERASEMDAPPSIRAHGVQRGWQALLSAMQGVRDLHDGSENSEGERDGAQARLRGG